MTNRLRVSVVSTGTANIASVLAALDKCGATCTIAERPDEIIESPYLVLPGVGAFGAAMLRLTSLGFTDALQRRISSGRPTLAICLGMQLLARYSEESPNVEGLGIFKKTVKMFRVAPRVPQFGWNKVEAAAGSRFLRSGYAYFANSFMLDEVDAGWTTAMSFYGAPFVAGVEREAVLACQFHPELSGPWGHELIGRWLNRGGQ